MPTGEFNRHQVCRMLATSEPMAALLLCMYDHSVARGDKFAPRAKKGTLVGFEGDNIYRVWTLDAPGSQGHQINRCHIG